MDVALGRQNRIRAGLRSDFTPGRRGLELIIYYVKQKWIRLAFISQLAKVHHAASEYPGYKISRVTFHPKFSAQIGLIFDASFLKRSGSYHQFFWKTAILLLFHPYNSFGERDATWNSFLRTGAGKKLTRFRHRVYFFRVRTGRRSNAHRKPAVGSLSGK